MYLYPPFLKHVYENEETGEILHKHFKKINVLHPNKTVFIIEKSHCLKESKILNFSPMKFALRYHRPDNMF